MDVVKYILLIIKEVFQKIVIVVQQRVFYYKTIVTRNRIVLNAQVVENYTHLKIIKVFQKTVMLMDVHSEELVD